MNQLNAIGRIGRDAEIRYTADSKPIASWSFALASGYGQKQVTTWLNCSLFGNRAETLAPMLLKGTQIGITGEILLRTYTDKQGAEKSSLECRVSDITLLGSKPNSAHEPQKPAKPEQSSGFDDFEDDIPF